MDKPSPYVGPRSYRLGETLYGRHQESLNLLRLVLAERIVLLYSPSGAGKTSLLMAKLVPDLEAEDFHVLPPARVSGALEPKAVTGAVNPYVASLIYTWEEERPKDTPPLADLTGIDLNGYLTQRSWIRSDPRPVVLILDQFEEILTRDQQDWNAKGEFFRQLGLALQNRERWAVIAMREEHIAGLDPYLDLLPTRLATRYRLELLSREKARDAIAEPARSVGVTYHADALSRLVSELTAVREPSADVYYTAYVEPLHLQVVCNRLWQRLPDGTAEVGPHLVDTTGTVGEALAGYYRDTVHSVAQTPVAVDAHCDEKRIRDWLENELISSSGLRDQLQRGTSTTGSLPNPVVDALEERYLLRFELRRGTPWYEIAHDRLIEAIKVDNQAWYETHPEEALRLFWDRGKKWQGHLEAGRSDQARAELLTGKSLAQVESWVARHARSLSAWDRRFLEVCRESERERSRIYRQDLRRRTVSVVVLLIFLLIGSYIWKQQKQQQAEALQQQAEALQLNETRLRAQTLLADAAQARWRLNDHGLAVLLTLQAERFSRRTTTDPQLPGRIQDTLRSTLRLRPFTSSLHLTTLRKEPWEDGMLAFSPDGRFVAVQSQENAITIAPLAVDQHRCRPYELHAKGLLRTVEFTASGQYLVAVTDSWVELFPTEKLSCANSPDGPATVNVPIAISSTPSGPFCMAAEDSLLFIAVPGGGVERWRVGGGAASREDPLPGRVDDAHADHASADDATPTAMACDPEGRWVAIGDATGGIRILWTTASANKPPSFLSNDFKQWPTDMQKEWEPYRQLFDYKGSLDSGVSVLIPWPKQPQLIAVFRHGPIGIVSLPQDGDPSLVYLRPTRDNRAERRGRAAFRRGTRELVRRSKFLRAVLDPATGHLVVGGERSMEVWALQSVYSDSDGQHIVPLVQKLPSDQPVYAPYQELMGSRTSAVEALSILELKGEKVIAAADAEFGIRLWPLEKLDDNSYAFGRISLRAQDSHPEALLALRFLPDGRTLAAGARYLAFLEVNLKQADLKQVKSLRLTDRSCVPGSFRSMSFSPDGSRLALVSRMLQDNPGCQTLKDQPKNAVWLMQSARSSDVNYRGDSVWLEVAGSKGLWSVAWARYPELLAAGDGDGHVWLWPLHQATGFPIDTSPQSLSRSYPSAVRAVAFHPTQPLLAVGTEDGLLELRRLAIDAAGRVTDTPLQNPAWVKRGSVRALAFSPDGHILVFGNDNGSVGVVVTPDRSSEWQESQLIFAHRMGVTALEFCGAPSAETQQGRGRRMCDDNTFVSAGNDGRVKFWQMNRENGTQKIQPMQTLEGPNAEVLSVALNPDEGLVAAGDAIGQIHVWRLDQEPTIENICMALHRNLSWQEWLQYVGHKLSYECTCPKLPPGWDVDNTTLKHAVDCPR